MRLRNQEEQKEIKQVCNLRRQDANLKKAKGNKLMYVHEIAEEGS